MTFQLPRFSRLRRLRLPVFLAAALLGVFSSPSRAADTWTSLFSEEDPPTGCPLGKLVTGYACTGAYCDNQRLRCSDVQVPYPTANSWKKFISEESRGTTSTESGVLVRKDDYFQRCGPTGFLKGVACHGKYCDQLSLECGELSVYIPANYACKYSGWVSEENGLVTFEAGYYAVGVECRGKFCDDKRFCICPLRNN